MRNNRIIPVVLAAVMLFSVTGCGKSDKSPSSSIPEGGWTLEALADATYICGKQLSYPLTLDSLGEDFTIDEASVQANGTGSQADIKYKDEKVCIFIFSCNEDEVSSSQAVERITFVPDESNRDSFEINGFTASDSFDELHKALGEPSRGKGTYVTEDGGAVIFSEGPGEAVYSIVIDFRKIHKAEE